MMMGVLQSNRDNVLSAIRTFRNSLDEIESVLENEDYAQLEEFLNQSRSSYSLLTDN
jgi:prephenate dehydrogenase